MKGEFELEKKKKEEEPRLIHLVSNNINQYAVIPPYSISKSEIWRYLRRLYCATYTGAQHRSIPFFGRGPLSRSFFSRVKMHPPAGEVSRRRQPTLASEPRPRTRAIG